MVLRILYVLAAIFIFTGCSLEANLEDLTSRNQLFIVLDESNKAINSSNIRSYAIKGSCQHVGEPVQITLEGRGTFEGLCDASKTFEVVLDLDGLLEGEIQMTVSQNETEIKKTSLDTKTILVDLTPPTVTVNAPDNADNYPVSSLRANYPITGACSDALNLVKVVTSLPSEHFLVCSALNQWELRMDLSAQTASSIDFYIQHFDTAGNISETKSVSIRYPQWQKISPDVTSTGYPAVRLISQYGDTGRILLSSPLRNDDLIDLGIVNFDGTGLTRMNPMSGQWGLDVNAIIIPVPKHSRALYVRSTVGRTQLKELHSVKIDGSGDRLLMGPTSVNPVGGVTTYALTPDQNTVIAMGDVGPTDNEFNLYAINVLTGAQTKLNGTMVAGGDVREFKISPDGSTVVFRMDKDIDEAINLYAVNVNGTNLRRLGPAMATAEAMQSDYVISADSKWVIYRENKTLAGSFALGAVSLVNGEVIDVSAGTVNGVTVMGQFSPNSRYVAYRTDRAIATCLELFVYDLQARSDVRVSVPCVNTTNDIGYFAWSAASDKVAYSQLINTLRFDLHVANVDGSGILQLTTATVMRNGLFQGFKDKSILFTPNGQKLIYQADMSGVVAATAGEMKFDLYAVNTDGSGAPVKLTSQSVSTVIRDYPVVEVSPQGDRVAYTADIEVDGKYEMYLSAVDGSSTRKLSPAISNVDGDVLTTSTQYFFDWSRNTVLMLADDTIEGVNGIYKASLSLVVAAPVKINMPLIRSGDYFITAPAGNGTKFAFRGNPDTDAEMHLFASDANGSNVVRVTKNYPAGGGKLVTSFAFTDNGAKLIYLADQDTPGLQELYVGDTNGAPPIKVNVPITNPNGAITAFKFNEATQKIYYIGDITTDTIPEMHSVNLDGTGGIKVTPDFGHSVVYTLWDVAKDGSYVVIRWDYAIDEKYEVAKVAVDGSGTITRLNSVIGNSFDIANFEISPDSQWVCYWGTTAVVSRTDVKVASVANPSGVNYMAAQGVDTTRMGSGCRFSEDSEYTVIPGDFVTDGRTTLKTFRIADQTLFDMNSGLPATSHTSLYQTLTEGANKRLIALSESAPDIYELYSMNLDGSDLRKISQAPYAGGQVNANNGTAVKFLNDANKTIVYTGLIETVGKWDLFAVKWDGTESRKLVTLNTYADIYDTFVSDQADRVFYRADNDKDGVLSLYSVKGDGTGLKNHMPGLQGNTGVWNSVMATSNRVLFTSDAYNSQTLEVFVDSF